VSIERADPTVSLPGERARPTRILLLRHGAAEGAREGRFFGRTDVGLLPEGEAQVRGAAPRLARWLREGGAVRVYASPLLRARRSAELLCESLSLPGPPEAVEGLSELDLGAWEGETHASLQAREPERLRAHYADFVRSRPPGGESLEDLARRVGPAMAGIRARAAGGEALVVAHAGVNRVILCEALGAPLERFFRIEQDFAALNVIDFFGEVPLVRLMNG